MCTFVQLADHSGIEIIYFKIICFDSIHDDMARKDKKQKNESKQAKEKVSVRIKSDLSQLIQWNTFLCLDKWLNTIHQMVAVCAHTHPHTQFQLPIPIIFVFIKQNIFSVG